MMQLKKSQNMQLKGMSPWSLGDGTQFVFRKGFKTVKVIVPTTEKRIKG